MEFQCDLCEQTFKTRQARHSHIKSIHEKIRYSCQFCTKTLTSKRRLNEHIKNHKGQLDHTCYICNKSFVSKRILTEHMKIHLAQKDHECLLCKKMFLTVGKLNQHMIIHTGEKPFKCVTCGKCFGRKGNLQSHQTTHSGKKPYKCLVCSASFGRRWYLNQHHQTHSKLTLTFSCPQCPRKYKSKDALRHHQKTHQLLIRVSNYQCIFCKNTFSSYGNLCMHLKAHVGESKVFCELCDREFTSQNNKNEHIRRQHTLEKPFVCGTCGVGFSAECDVRKHSVTHISPNEPKAHSCIFCEKDFHQRGNLFRHIKAHIKEREAAC